MSPRAILLLIAMQLVTATSAAPHGDTPRTCGWGTATIDGVRSPGEWDAASVVAVFTGLPGCTLYLMNDAANLYLGLWVSDASLISDDILGVRFDTGHDGLMTLGDDQFSVSGADGHLDAHFTGATYAGDLLQHGSGAAGPDAGGAFFEAARPLNSSDPDDVSLEAGETTAICVRYFDNGTGGTSLEFPLNCPLVPNQQALYVDVVTTVNPVAVGGLAGRADGLQVFPNPAGRGSEVEVRYRVPEGGSQVEIGVYTIAGRKVASRAGSFETAGPGSWRWNAPALAPERPAPGGYLVRVRFGTGETRSAMLFLR